MQVVLRPVATMDLTTRFARIMDGKKIKQYAVPFSHLAMAGEFGITAQDMVTKHILENESDVTNVVFEEPFEDSHYRDLDDAFLGKSTTIGKTSAGGALEVIDISPIILSDMRQVGRSLSKTKAYSMIHQTNYYKTVFHAYYDRLLYFYNSKVVPFVNKAIYRFYGLDYGIHNPFVRQLSYKQQIYDRKFNPVSFISVAFEASDALEAINALKQDLSILHKNKLIMGHLAMPSVMRLANTVGDGIFYVMFCFPIIDQARLDKLIGSPSEVQTKTKYPLSLLGVQNQGGEGEIRWLNDKDPHKLFDVEVVYISDVETLRRDIVIKTYEEAKPLVNQIAKARKEELANWEKVESRSHFGINEAAIDVTLRNKVTGETRNVDAAAYKQNDSFYEKPKKD